MNSIATPIKMGTNASIQLDGDVIRYKSISGGGWSLALADVRVIGECTNQSGPFADDYFFCFATGPGAWCEASFYSNGRDEFLRALEAKLGVSFNCGLVYSAEFASRVFWPPTIAGGPMFKYENVPSRGLIGKLFRLRQVNQFYSDSVAAVLAGEN
jgi:hypothetical protein